MTHTTPRPVSSLKGKMMKTRLTKIIFSTACALAPLAVIPASPAYAQSSVQPTQEVVLSIGRGELINVPGSMTDIFVANEQIADVQVKSRRQLYVFGLAGGRTTIYASNAAGDIIWSANVSVGSNIDSIDQMLSLAMPQAQISVATMGANMVLLTGTVAAPEDAAEAERLVMAYVGEDANVISRLKMATPLQVNLRVRIAEVSRSLVRSIGANITSLDGTGGFKFGVSRGRDGFFDQVNTNPNAALGLGQNVTTTLPDGTVIEGTNLNPLSGATTIGGLGKLLGLDLVGALDLGETEGLVTTLAQPNLTALSGETAEFLAGGEYPIPIDGGDGTTTIEYKKYGVSLSYSPTVLSNGRISLRVRPEVSELSTQGAVTLNGFQVPALTIRRTETTVELGSGQSMMIAGLLSTNASRTIDKTPGAGDVPILGNLFRSRDFRNGETELVIVVTPYLVRPVNDSEIRLPTDGYASATELDQLLLNRDSSGRSGDVRPMPRAASDMPANPQVSLIDQTGTAMAGAEDNTNGAQTASAAQPGFSLK